MEVNLLSVGALVDILKQFPLDAKCLIQIDPCSKSLSIYNSSAMLIGQIYICEELMDSRDGLIVWGDEQ